MNDTAKYRVKWYRSVQKPNLGRQVQDCYCDAELKSLISRLRMGGKVYQIIRLNQVESYSNRGLSCESQPCTDRDEST